MKEIEVKALSDEAFRKYGEYQDLINDYEMANRSLPGDGFKPDLIWLNFGNQNPPTISICHIRKSEKMIVKFIEYHKYTCECLVPLDDDVIIYVGIPAPMGIKVDHLEAFYVPKYTAVKLNPCILHGGQFPVNNEEAHLICMLPARTFMNDMNYKIIQNEDEMAQIIYNN